MISTQSKERIMHFFNHVRELWPDLFNFNKRNQAEPLLGIEINSDFLKVLHLKKLTDTQKDKDPYQVENFAIIPLPAGAVVKAEIKDTEKVASFLKQTLLSLDIKNKNIAFAIPRSAAIIKNLMVDRRLNADEVEARVWTEANRLFPNLIGEIYLDFVVQERTPDAAQQEVIVVACRKEQIKPYLEVARIADLYTQIVDVNCYALERTLSLYCRRVPELKTVALLNLTFSLVTLIVVHEGQLIYTHELNYDGSVIKEKLGIDSKTRVLTNKKITQKPFHVLKETENLKSSLGLHLRHIMQFFYSSRANIRIQEILLSGICPGLLPELKHFVQEEIGIQAVVLEPFKDMSVASHIKQEELHQYGPALSLCCGLALSKLT